MWLSLVSDILVSGLINIEVTLRVDAFPITYTPVRYPFFGVDSTVSGVGYNVARALTALGDTVHLVSMVGQDLAADQVRRALDRDGIPGDLIVVNTIGAGDALFSAFIHFYNGSQDPYEALRKAIVFASYKIGEAGAAEGFLDQRGLEDLAEGVTRES